MKRIQIKYEHRYVEDVMRIQKVLADHDWDATLPECEELWDKYSESMSAGWMGLPRQGKKGDQEIYFTVSSYMDED